MNERQKVRDEIDSPISNDKTFSPSILCMYNGGIYMCDMRPSDILLFMLPPSILLWKAEIIVFLYSAPCETDFSEFWYSVPGYPSVNVCEILHVSEVVTAPTL